MATGIVRRNDEEDEICRPRVGQAGVRRQQPVRTTAGSWPPSAAVTVDDLKAWHERNTRGKLIVAVSGDFDPAAMEAKLRGVFEGTAEGEGRSGAARCFSRI